MRIPDAHRFKAIGHGFRLRVQRRKVICQDSTRAIVRLEIPSVILRAFGISRYRPRVSSNVHALIFGVANSRKNPYRSCVDAFQGDPRVNCLATQCRSEVSALVRRRFVPLNNSRTRVSARRSENNSTVHEYIRNSNQFHSILLVRIDRTVITRCGNR